MKDCDRSFRVVPGLSTRVEVISAGSREIPINYKGYSRPGCRASRTCKSLSIMSTRMFKGTLKVFDQNSCNAVRVAGCLTNSAQQSKTRWIGVTLNGYPCNLAAALVTHTLSPQLKSNEPREACDTLEYAETSAQVADERPWPLFVCITHSGSVFSRNRMAYLNKSRAKCYPLRLESLRLIWT